MRIASEERTLCKPMGHGIRAWLIVSALALECGRAEAELVYFARGGEAQVHASWSGSTLRVEIPGRSYRFARGDVGNVIPGYWPADQWPARRAAALAGGAEARFAAAWWALENGLTPEAESMLREAHRADPSHPQTARMIGVLDRLARPLDDPDVTALQQALGSASEIARGPHVLLLHQHSAAEAAERVELLERVVVTYYLVLSSRGFDLAVPERRMASAWFADHEGYLGYLNRANLGVFRTTRGYYHPTLNAVMTYDGRSSGSQKTARDANAARRSELDRMAEVIKTLPARARLGFEVREEPRVLLTRAGAESRLDELRRDLDRRELLLELDWRAVDLGTAAHEMVHQLVATSGLAPHHDDFPLWLHEGFAAQFEVIRGGRWAGVGRAHDIRLKDWRSLQSPAHLDSLVHDTGFGRGYQRGLYAQAWGLVYFLKQEHPAQFQTFLDLLRAPDVETDRGKARAADAFRTAFGDDLDALETHWHQFLDRVQTPLEEHHLRENSKPREPAPSPIDRNASPAKMLGPVR